MPWEGPATHRGPWPEAPWEGPPWRRGPRLFGRPVIPVAFILFIQVVGTYFAGLDEEAFRPYDLGAAILLAAGPASLLLRGRFPVGVLAFTLFTTGTYFVLGYPHGPIFFALLVAFFGAALAGKRAAAATSIAIGYVTFVWLGYWVGTRPAPGLAGALGAAAWLLVLFTVSEIARGRRDRAIERMKTHREEERRRASDERLRIARELHDVLAHNISLINVQAGVALHLIDERPEQARGALGAIKDASNEALSELRSVLDILRQGNERGPRSPTSGLTDLDDLVARTRAAGFDVAVEVEGAPRPLPTGVDLAAFRIVQEAVTNVTRHAPAARMRIRLSYEPESLVVEIADDGAGGTGEASKGAGAGIAGMKERAAALGGELEAGPRPGGGFLVRARLPLPEDVR